MGKTLWSFGHSECSRLKLLSCYTCTAEMTLIICDTAEKTNTLIKGSDSWKKVRQIIVMDGLDDVDMELAKTKNIELSSYSDVLVSFVC